MTNPTVTNLLERITSFKAAVGDDPTDEEVICLLRQVTLPSEHGFTFVSLCKGYVTFSVPFQDPKKWYSPIGRMSPEKEAIARAIANQYGFSLSDPPDFASSTFSSFEFSSTNIYHHFEMDCRSETIVIAHRLYLKIHLFDFATNETVPLHNDLLARLAALYQT